MTRKLAVVAACLVVAGCGGGPAAKADEGATYKDAEDLAKTIGCDTYQADSEPMMFAAQSSSCTLQGADYGISWFNNNAARDKYLKVGVSNGAAYAYGNRWIVECRTPAQADTIAQVADGKTKSS